MERCAECTGQCARFAKSTTLIETSKNYSVGSKVLVQHSSGAFLLISTIVLGVPVLVFLLGLAWSLNYWLIGVLVLLSVAVNAALLSRPAVSRRIHTQVIQPL